MKTEPESVEELQAWDLVTGSSGIFKSAGMGGLAGFDIPALSEIVSAYGWDKKTVFDLVFSVEQKILETLKSKAE